MDTLQRRIIADVYFVSNRNGGKLFKGFIEIIADVYFVSNRNIGRFYAVNRNIIADVYFVSNRNEMGIQPRP